jgi:hypothetical protein
MTKGVSRQITTSQTGAPVHRGMNCSLVHSGDLWNHVTYPVQKHLGILVEQIGICSRESLAYGEVRDAS